MTNSFNKMAGKNSAERNGTPGRPRSTSKLRPLKVTNATFINSSMLIGGTPPARSLPINIINNNNYYHQYHSSHIRLNNISEVSNHHGVMKLRLSPSMASVTSTGSSPNSSCSSRTSPGLVAGYFAGGKWSDPPSAASLPKPPQHWTYANNSAKCSPFPVNGKPQQTDIASQMKVLLNVQA